MFQSGQKGWNRLRIVIFLFLFPIIIRLNEASPTLPTSSISTELRESNEGLEDIVAGSAEGSAEVMEEKDERERVIIAVEVYDNDIVHKQNLELLCLDQLLGPERGDRVSDRGRDRDRDRVSDMVIVIG
jgi:hypothetical protein